MGVELSFLCVEIGFGFFLRGVLFIFDFLVEGFRFGEFGGGRLRAGGKSFLERSAGFGGVRHDSVGENSIGMANHAGGGV